MERFSPRTFGIEEIGLLFRLYYRTTRSIAIIQQYRTPITKTRICLHDKQYDTIYFEIDSLLDYNTSEAFYGYNAHCSAYKRKENNSERETRISNIDA